MADAILFSIYTFDDRRVAWVWNVIHFQKGKAKFERKAEYNQHSHEEVIWEYYNFSDNISCFFAITYTY